MMDPPQNQSHRHHDHPGPAGEQRLHHRTLPGAEGTLQPKWRSGQGRRRQLVGALLHQLNPDPLASGELAE